MFGTRVVTAQEMRELDKRATEIYGIPSIVLMENAGRAVYDAAVDVLDGVDCAHVAVVAGPGNNGGDGFVAARHLHNAGAFVKIFYFGDREAAKGDALTNIEIAEKMGLEIDSSRDLNALEAAIKNSGLVIDALLGTGVKGEVRPELAAVIGCINEHRSRGSVSVIAVDIPSGLDADTGQPLGPKATREAPKTLWQSAVEADVTVTFAFLKLGPAIDADSWFYTGKIIVADIGIPKQEGLSERPVFEMDDGGLLPPRKASANKGDLGHLAVVAGSVGMTGAATLAAEAALRSGAGLVTLLVPESLNDIMEAKVTEAMTIPVPQGKARAFGIASLDKVLEYVGKWDGAVIGPGFGRDEDTIAFTQELIRRLEKPAVVDADALYAISRDLSVLKECKGQLVLTPHPGEMAMLLGTTAADVQSNRLEVARKFAQDYGVVLILKGARTIIAEPGGLSFINMTGTPGMATGGTGDVLTGLIGGLIVQEPISLWQSANTAVWVHGKAGELAAEELGESAMIAGDLLKYLPAVLKELEIPRQIERE